MFVRIRVMNNTLPEFSYHDNHAAFHNDTTTRYLLFLYQQTIQIFKEVFFSLWYGYYM